MLRMGLIPLGCALALFRLALPTPAQAWQREDLAAKARRGDAAMTASRFEEAAALYGEIVRVFPNEPGMRLNLGLAHAMAGRPAEAIPHFEVALKLRPGLVNAAFFLGAAHMELGRPTQAVAPLETVVKAQPDNVQARRMLADALLALQRFEPARRHYRKLAEAVPDLAAAWYGLGRSYEGLAAAAVERLQSAAPESPWMMLLAAEALAAQGRHANAFRLYRRALETRPTVVATEVHEALAQIYEKTGHGAWAAAEREAGRKVPLPDCRARTQECDFRAGRHEAVLNSQTRPGPARHYWRARAAGELARAAFARLDQLPPSPEAALMKAEVLAAQRHHVDAAVELRRASDSWPRDERLRRALASALHTNRDYAAARSLLEDLVRSEPGDAELVFLLGDTLLQQQEPAAALPLLEKAVAAAPEMLHARAAFARALVASGEAGRAIPHLLAAAPLDQDGSLYYQLSRAYQAAGQAAQAAEAVKKSQERRAAAEKRQRDLEEEFKITPP